MSRIDTLERIAREPDHHVLHAVEHLHDRLVEANTFDTAVLLEGVAGEATALEAMTALVDDATAHYDQALSDAESVRFARAYLVALAALDDDARRLVNESLREWSDERQTVGKVLARGAVVSLLLIGMSTSVTYESGPLRIEKQALSAEQMRALGEVAVSLVERLGVKRKGVDGSDGHAGERPAN